MPDQPTHHIGPDPVSDEVLRERVRQFMGERSVPSASPWEHFTRNELVRLIVGFVLTGIVGALLTAQIQKNAEDRQKRAESRETLRSAQVAQLDTLGGLLSRGYYAFSRYYDAIRVGPRWPADTMTARQARAKTFRDEFYSRSMLFDARTCALFGPDALASQQHVDKAVQMASSTLSDYKDGTIAREAAWATLSTLQKATYELLLKLASSSADTTGRPYGQCGDAPESTVNDSTSFP